ncbi:MAG: hypothetical protein ABIQ18_24620 [Umezawaea sp.]
MRNGELRLAKTGAPLAFAWSFDLDVAELNPTMVVLARERTADGT